MTGKYDGLVVYGFWSAVGPMPLGASTCWLFGRSRGTLVLHIVVVLHVEWRSGATTIDCFAGCVALRCYNYWLFCRLCGAPVLQLLVVLQVVWRSGATTIDCFAGSVALPCYNY